MHLSLRTILIITLTFFMHSAEAGRCRGNIAASCPSCCDQCCGQMGGIQYCDSSSGRYVCNNGYYSSCYCTRHAIMDLQNIQGCCLWQGGIATVDIATGTVICNDGGTSEICSEQSAPEPVASW